MTQIRIDIAARQDGAALLAPLGMITPYGRSRLQDAVGKDHRCDSGNTLVEIATGSNPVTIVYDVDGVTGPYAPDMFRAQTSRFTRAADALIADAQNLREVPDPAKAIADHVAQLFTYGHPDTRFYDDPGFIPQICDIAEGSCVDINAYFIASLRAIGISTGYVTGYFFPAEKTGPDGAAWCEDAHCWVVTQDAFGTREWDIAHHLKMGTRDIRAALDPKPGRRVAIAHSMGLSFPSLGLQDVKLISEPIWRTPEGVERPDMDIRLAA